MRLGGWVGGRPTCTDCDATVEREERRKSWWVGGWVGDIHLWWVGGWVGGWVGRRGTCADSNTTVESEKRRKGNELTDLLQGFVAWVDGWVGGWVGG